MKKLCVAVFLSVMSFSCSQRYDYYSYLVDICNGNARIEDFYERSFDFRISRIDFFWVGKFAATRTGSMPN